MSRETLTVPERFVALFREGVVDSIRSDADGLRSAADSRSMEVAIADLRSSLTQVVDDVDLLDRVPADPDGDVSVEADAAALAHALESTARAVCGPRLTDRLGVGPFDSDLTAEIVLLTDAIEWAAEQADRFHGIAEDGRSA